MGRLWTGVAVVVFVCSAYAASAAERYAGSLNFSNVTATNVVQTVAETASNEKEVDYGDFDNDNDLDVVIAVAYSDFGQRKNKLYRNNSGVFNEISGAPAIPGFAGTDVTRNAFFRDYNADGWLDIIVINDNNTGGDGGRTKIYMNNHPGDVFTNYTEEGIARLGNGTGGAACSGVSIDNDNDGDIDLYVGNYPNNSQDTMYFNNGTGFFTSMTATHVPTDGDYTVDVASADMNGDGMTDLLITSETFDNSFIYYNNLNNLGGTVGDYRYAGGQVSLGPAGVNENGIEPADFDNDGDKDAIWTNATASGSRVLRNDGNNGSNQAIMTQMAAGTLPASVTGFTCRKTTVRNLNHDGRIDALVMKEAGTGSRPTILRNTSVGGVISFVDWTPAPAFPNGSTHQGWHAAAFDASGDGWEDIFVGGWANDHLFQSVSSNQQTEAGLPGGATKTLPALYNLDPVTVKGGGAKGETDAYQASGLAAGAFASVVVNAPADLTVELRDGANTLLLTSNRGGVGVEEAFQRASAPSTIKVNVTIGRLGGDADDDGRLDLGDAAELLNAFGTCGGGACAVFDCNADGEVDLTDWTLFTNGMSGPTEFANVDYFLDVLSRN